MKKLVVRYRSFLILLAVLAMTALSVRMSARLCMSIVGILPVAGGMDRLLPAVEKDKIYQLNKES